MNIAVIGISHRSSSIETREKFYLRPGEREWLLRELRADVRILEALVISTCNRTEIYVNTLESPDFDALLATLARVKKLPADGRAFGHFYRMEGPRAVQHLFEVAAGLDSVVLGEKQILGQVKKAVAVAEEADTLGKSFHVLSNLVVRAAKKAQHETDISFGGSSVSWAAVTTARNIFGTLQDKSVLIIGTGKMGELAVEQLRAAGVENIYLVNRTCTRAEHLARQCGGSSAGFWELKEILPKADICICSAGAPHYLVGPDAVSHARSQRNGARQVFIDISMPRNIDPAIKDIEGVFLLTIDDLGMVVEENVRRRETAVQGVQEIIAEKMDAFYDKMEKIRTYAQRPRVPVLENLRDTAARPL